MKNVKGTRNFYNIKKLYLVLGLFLVLLLGIGYAVLNTTLSINGVADISKNTWDVHFENVVINDGNVVATTPATIGDNSTEVTFSVPLSKPGDSYSFLVDIVNNGSINAKLSKVLKTGITTTNESYLIFDVEYLDGQMIGVNDALRVGDRKTISVTVGYNRDITNDELVTTDESISLSLKMTYVQDDGSAIDVEKTLYRVTRAQAVLDNISSKYVTSNKGIDFSSISSDTNGKGVYTVSSTNSDEYPISYYRGAVDNNYVIFAGFCWKMVRTTDTGGVKMIYNGVPDSNGACTATGTGVRVASSSFNGKSASASDVGYMYGARYYYNTKNMNIAAFKGLSQTTNKNMSSTNYIYSDTVTYDSTTGLYTLVNGENRVWQDTYINGRNQYKYTCLSENENTCTSVNYILQSSSSTSAIYVALTAGDTAEETLNKQIVFGNDVSYDSSTGMYKLVTTTTSSIKDWINNYKKILGANGYHYTCFTDSDTCSDVNYIYFHYQNITVGSYGTSYYIILQNGKDIEDAFNEMFSTDNDVINQTDSTIKGKVDTWYSSNMTEYTSMLEDTVWCNDRSVYDYGGWKKDLSSFDQLLFAPFARTHVTFKPTLACVNKNDSFTVDDTTKGNGKLTYPIGLLTSDEAMYAGGFNETSNPDSYLNAGNLLYWLASPAVYYDGSVNHFMFNNGLLYIGYVYGGANARPAISVKQGTKYTSGNGTKSNPYIVEKQ